MNTQGHYDDSAPRPPMHPVGPMICALVAALTLLAFLAWSLSPRIAGAVAPPATAIAPRPTPVPLPEPARPRASPSGRRSRRRPVRARASPVWRLRPPPNRGPSVPRAGWPRCLA
jgi:hypothetical protein